MHAAPVLEAPKLEAPVLVAPVLVALVLAAPVLAVPVLEAPVLHNFKGIYAVLSRIWKCRKSRVFGANFLGEKFSWCYNSRFLQLWVKITLVIFSFFFSLSFALFVPALR